MATYVTNTHLENFTATLLVNDKKIRDELKQEISNLPSGGGSGSSYTLPTASTTTLGGVKVDGTTVTINPDGVISATASGSGSYTLPKATDTTLGGVKVDNDTITVDSEGVISATKELPIGGTTGQMLVKKSGTNYDVEWKDTPQGGSAVDVATTNKAGIVKPDGTSITVDADGTIHATTDTNQIKQDIEDYMTQHPVSAIVGNKSISFNNLKDDMLNLLDTVDITDLFTENSGYDGWPITSHITYDGSYNVIKVTANFNSNIPAVAFYDETDNLISKINISKNSYTLTAVVPKNTSYYVIGTNTAAITNKVFLSKAINNEPIISLSNNKSELQALAQDERLMDMSLFVNKDIYYDSKGVIKNASTFMCSDILDLDFTHIHFKYTGANSSVGYLIFYDVNKKQIEYNSPSANGNLEVDKDVPEGAYYYRIQAKNTLTEVYLSGTSDSFKKIYDNSKKIDVLTKRLDDKEDTISVRLNDLLTETDLRMTNGSTKQYGTYAATRELEVYFKRITIPHNGTTAFPILYFFDKNMNVLNAIFSNADGNVIDVPDDAVYYKIQHHDNIDVYATVEHFTLLDNRMQRYETKKTVESLSRQMESAYTSSFPQVKYLISRALCIGDSLTEGYYGAPIKAVKPESYPYFLSKITGWECVNKGVSGQRTMVIGNRICTDSTLNDQEFDVIYSFCGTNYWLTDTIDADITNNGDGTFSYANTDTGQYCRMLAYLKEKWPNAVIFLINLPIGAVEGTADYTRRLTANAVISKLSEKYDCPLIDLYNDSPFINENNAIYRPNDGCHFNKYGYAALANHIYTKTIEWMTKPENANKFDYK